MDVNQQQQDAVQEKKLSRRHSKKKGLTEKQKNDFREIFEKYDQDKNETITFRELVEVLRFFKQNPTKKDIKRLMEDLEVEKDEEQLNFAEYMTLMELNIRDEETVRAELLAAFRVLDEDNDGFLSKEQLKKDLINEDFSEADLNKMILEADVDGDGKINYNEYVDVLMNNNDRTAMVG